ncbi:hypothetical protein RJ639_038018 [Escallonia herrerae]|uniref:Uncharacterized protein n=1 Tax=Escallonia herrerae TaxID=1293975 RepID=A0AA88WL24_9ASTE|nr:hypothetical protein RJ639_038018 [Escallonia herrerae]
MEMRRMYQVGNSYCLLKSNALFLSSNTKISSQKGYDMRFDIKYAYFNFLQCIHLPMQKGLKSPSCASKRCLKNKKGIIASAANGSATGCCDNCEEE